MLVVRDATALTASITGGNHPLRPRERLLTLDGPLDDATTVETITQELRLSGLSGKTTWVAGAFYSTIDRDYAQTLFVGGYEAATGIPTAGSFLAGTDNLFISDLRYQFDQFALFGELTYAVNDRFNLTGGLRFYDFEEDRVQTFDGIFAAPGTSSGSTAADGFAPRVIASYRVSDNTLLNAQISKGFRLGGINDPLNVPLCTPADLATFSGQDAWGDEELWNYEVGAKSTVMGGRGTFNIAAYYIDITDLQATITAGSCSSRLVFNVPSAESQGIELEFAAAASSNFDFAISASYNDSELQSEAAGNISGISRGNRLPTVPEFQAAAAATYQWQMKNDRLGFVTGTYQHVGSRFTQVGDHADGFGTVDLLTFPGVIGGPLTQNTFSFNPELPAYDIVNLRIGVNSERWETALFINNVTDEIAFLALDQERGSRARVGYLTNPPRTYGVSTRVKF